MKVGASEWSHWFGEHPNGRQSDERYANWLKEFPALKEISEKKGIEVYNCSPDSALECFEKIDIDVLFKRFS